MGLSVVVLAAGEGKRFHSAVPKPLHQVAGRPLLWHVLAATRGLSADRTVVVVGRGAEEVRGAVAGFGLGPVAFAVQDELRGTGDALAAALPELPGGDPVLVLYGDQPLLPGPLLADLLGAHAAGGARLTLLACRSPQPAGYGRVVRDGSGRVTGVVEEADATPAQRAIDEINAGVYVVERDALEGLSRLDPHNAQGECYLTGLVGQIAGDGGRVEAFLTDDEVSTRGVNDRAQLAAAGQVLRERVLTRLMASGVTVVDPATTFVDSDVEVAADATLLPLTFLEAGTAVGAGCTIGPNARLAGCEVAERASVSQAVCVGARIGAGSTVGPFAYLRPGTELGPGSKVGSYVEVKASSVGAGSKVPHLSYVGDATIGEGVNVGAGTVFVNYDGAKKHHTTVGDGAFIGSDSMLVAPVTIGEGAQTAAGSTITKDVPPDALAIERSDQRTIEGWAARRRRRQQAADAAGPSPPEHPAGAAGEGRP